MLYQNFRSLICKMMIVLLFEFVNNKLQRFINFLKITRKKWVFFSGIINLEAIEKKNDVNFLWAEGAEFEMIMKLMYQFNGM
jgi:hypothetical protein